MGVEIYYKKVCFGKFWFCLAEVSFGQVWLGSDEFGLVEAGVIWFSFILSGLVNPQTNKQNE